MTPSVNLLQLFDADFGVNRGGVEFFVAEQLLDEPDVGPVLQHVGGATVTKHVATPFAFQARLLEPT